MRYRTEVCRQLRTHIDSRDRSRSTPGRSPPEPRQHLHQVVDRILEALAAVAEVVVDDLRVSRRHHVAPGQSMGLAGKTRVLDDLIQPSQILGREIQWHDQMPFGDTPAFLGAGLHDLLEGGFDLALLTSLEIVVVLFDLVHGTLGAEPRRPWNEDVDAVVTLTGPHTNGIREPAAQQHRDDSLDVLARLPRSPL